MSATKSITRVGISPFSAEQHIGVYRSFLVSVFTAKKTDGETFLRIDDTNPKHTASIDEMINDMSKIIEPELFSPISSGELGRGTIGEKGIQAIFESSRLELYDRYLTKLQDDDYIFYDGGAAFFNVEKYIKTFGNLIDVSYQGKKNRVMQIDKVMPNLRFPLAVNNKQRFLWHFTSVVDDVSLGVTHVVRAKDKIDNQVPQTIISKALDLSSPKYLYTKIMLCDEFLPTVDSLLARGISTKAIKSYLYGTITGQSDKIYMSFKEALDDFSVESVLPGQFRFDLKKVLSIQRNLS